MEKFTLYELLSYLLPGFLFLLGSSLYLSNYQFYNLLDYRNFLNNDFLIVVLVLGLSLIIGGIIHRISMYFISIRFYNKLGLYDNIIDIFSKESDIHFIVSTLNKQYKLYCSNNNSNINILENSDAIDKLFDYIYYYLDIEKKNETVLSYQSFYFLFRNLCTICILFFVFNFIHFLYIVFTPCCCIIYSILYLQLLLLFLFVVFLLTGKWFRKKMVIKLFFTYYVLLTSKK